MGVIVRGRGSCLGNLSSNRCRLATLYLINIILDKQNTRIVSQKIIEKQSYIVRYIFEHEDLLGFIKKIAQVGKNKGAERPYVVKEGSKFTVVEGNTRIAAYKVLSGLLPPPPDYKDQVPSISDEKKTSLLVVDCSIAPTREALLPIIVQAHFGEGDKSKWGYLGSRKALHDEYKSGKSVQTLGRIFHLKNSDVIDLLIEYQLYLESLKLGWTPKEKAKLLYPNVAFNPPVRFLESRGHKDFVGIEYDKANLAILFKRPDAKKRLKHVVKNLVVDKKPGLSGPSSAEAVFKDYVDPASVVAPTPSPSPKPSSSPSPAPAPTPASSRKAKLKPHALFNYQVTAQSALLRQLMKEAKGINAKSYPAAATFLLRNILEALLKHLVDEAKANPAKKSLSLHDALSLCQSKNVPLSADERKVLKEVQKHHLDYLNLGPHGGLVPNYDRTIVIRDVIDQFVKANI